MVIATKNIPVMIVISIFLHEPITKTFFNDSFDLKKLSLYCRIIKKIAPYCRNIKKIQRSIRNIKKIAPYIIAILRK